MRINKHSIAKKAIAILLTITMVPTLVPSISWADDGDGSDGESTPPAQEEPKEPKPEPKPEPTPEPKQETVSEPAAEPDSGDSSGSTEESGAADSGETITTEEAAAAEEEIETEEEDKMPAVSFSDSAGGLAVRISAPEGALPEGTKVKVSGVSTGQAKAIAQRAIGDSGKIRDAKGVDISFYDKSGKKIEPAKAVTVTLSGAGVRGNDPAIYHQGSGGVQKVKSLSSGNGGSFSASDFSVYVVAAEYYTVSFKMDEEDGGIDRKSVV